MTVSLKKGKCLIFKMFLEVADALKLLHAIIGVNYE